MWNINTSKLINIKTKSDLELLASALNTKYEYEGPIALSHELGYRVYSTTFTDDDIVINIDNNQKIIYIREENEKNLMSYYLYIAIAMIDLTEDDKGYIKEVFKIKEQNFYDSIITDYAVSIMLPKNFIKTDIM